MAQTTDLLPTLLRALGVPVPVAAVGAVVEPVPTDRDAAERLQRVRDLDLAAQAVQPAMWWFFNCFVIGQVLVYGLATLALRRRSGGPRALVLNLLRWGVTFACVPARDLPGQICALVAAAPGR